MDLYYKTLTVTVVKGEQVFEENFDGSLDLAIEMCKRRLTDELKLHIDQIEFVDFSTLTVNVTYLHIMCAWEIKMNIAVKVLDEKRDFVKEVKTKLFDVKTSSPVIQSPSFITSAPLTKAPPPQPKTYLDLKEEALKKGKLLKNPKDSGLI